MRPLMTSVRMTRPLQKNCLKAAQRSANQNTLRHHHQKWLNGFSQSEHVAPPSNDNTDSARRENENLLLRTIKYLNTKAFLLFLQRRPLGRFRGIYVPLCSNFVCHLFGVEYNGLDAAGFRSIFWVQVRVSATDTKLKKTSTPAVFIFLFFSAILYSQARIMIRLRSDTL